MIAVEGLHKDRRGVRALEGVSFDVPARAVVGIVGPNGAGKTTLLDILAGADAPTAGTVTLGGARIDRLAAHAIAMRGVARTFQAPRLFARMTAHENVLAGTYRLARDGCMQRLTFSASARADARERSSKCLEILSSLGLADVAAADVRHLSEGERRRVEIARAIATDPVVLLLDEPLSGLSENEAAIVRAAIAAYERSRNVAVLVAERDIRTCLGWCDRLVVLHAGRKIAEGTPEACRRDPEVLDAYLGVEWRQ